MIELTMSPTARRSSTSMNMVIAALFGLILIVPGVVMVAVGLPLGWLYLALGPVMIGLTALLVRRQNGNSLLRFGDGTYTLRGLGREKRFTVDDVERVVTVSRMGLGALGETHHLIVVGRDRRLLILVGYMWSIEQMTQLSDDLVGRGVPLYPFPQPITPAQLRAVDRRLIPFIQAHPVASGLLIGLGALMLIIVILLILVFILVALS
ncbi:hypothetical protein AB0N73_00650 [Microbacterium sp. NPDC089189]|uniref:hypothetical protein n=1 Tax=Microbacterium sp. NPDC089189 TaxID=3154972 RepID=UPI003442D137